MNELVGKTPVRVLLAHSGFDMWFVMNDGSCLRYEAAGDCCARAFFFQCEGFEDVVGHEVLAVHTSETETAKDDPSPDGDGVLDAKFITIRTAKGIANIEFRVEHNGYYDGEAYYHGECLAPEGQRVLAEVAR